MKESQFLFLEPNCHASINRHFTPNSMATTNPLTPLAPKRNGQPWNSGKLETISLLTCCLLFTGSPMVKLSVVYPLENKDGSANMPQDNVQWDTWLSAGNVKTTVNAHFANNLMRQPTTSFNALTHELTYVGIFNFNNSTNGYETDQPSPKFPKSSSPVSMHGERINPFYQSKFPQQYKPR